MSQPTEDPASTDSPISRIALFHGLSAKSLARVASIATAQRYPVGTILFRAGDVGDRLYLITEGRVRISREVPGMGEEALAIMGAGDYFGEMAVIDPAPRSADAHVHEACSVLEIRKDEMEHLLLVHRDLAYEVLWNVVRTLTARLRDTTDKVTFLAVTGRFS
jgi:CRP/FNR family cyclic AMP-dependent transcriptional regulator